MTDTSPARSARRTRLFSAAVLLCTFALGLVGGVGIAPLVRPPPSPLPPSLGALHLRPEQQERVVAIIERHAPEVEAALGDAAPRLRAVQERVALEIEAELDASQREAFRRNRASRPGPTPH
jgi:hypothetical protein